MNRKTTSLAVTAAVVGGLCFSSAPRSAFANNELSSKANPPETSTDINPAFEITPRVGWRYFTWTEFGPNGAALLTESGSLLVVGVDPRIAFGPKKRFFVDAGTSSYFGKVDYDGQTQNGDPYKSKTGYFGLELAPTAGYVFSVSRRFQLTPTGGLGFEYWHRDLDDGGPHGYDEKYTVFRIQAGLRGTYLLNRDVGFYSTLQLKIPVSISESVHLGARGVGQPLDVNLSPGISPAILIEGGSTIRGVVDVALYFETWTLTKSNLDKGFLQPDSTRQIFGIRVGHSFTL
jgi:hypothetical protein